MLTAGTSRACRVADCQARKSYLPDSCPLPCMQANRPQYAADYVQLFARTLRDVVEQVRYCLALCTGVDRPSLHP